MDDQMKIEVRYLSDGVVTTAGYIGPCGSQMAASFYGVLNEAQVRQTLERNRKIAATIPMYEA